MVYFPTLIALLEPMKFILQVRNVICCKKLNVNLDFFVPKFKSLSCISLCSFLAYCRRAIPFNFILKNKNSFLYRCFPLEMISQTRFPIKRSRVCIFHGIFYLNINSVFKNLSPCYLLHYGMTSFSVLILIFKVDF